MSKLTRRHAADQVTQTVRAGLECDDATGAVVPPIHLTSTFAFRGFGEKGRYDYTRSGNPTRDLLGEAIAELELGVGAVVTATGMAAGSLVGYLIPAGARIVAPHDCYGGAAASGKWSSSISATSRPSKQPWRDRRRFFGSRRRAIRCCALPTSSIS